MLIRLFPRPATGGIAVHQSPSLVSLTRSYPSAEFSQIPLHTLIKITPLAYGCNEERYPLPIAAVDTHRPKPKRGNKLLDDGFAPSRAPVSRDYFGDPPLAVQPEAVSLALEKNVDAGTLTPRAAAGGAAY